MLAQPRSNKGTCEICDTPDISVYPSRGNMMVCLACKAKEDEAVKTIAESKAVDASIETKSDVYLAKTVPAVELRAAIQNNPDIPEDKKDYAYAQECMTRFQNLQKVIFETRKDLLEKENEARMWQTITQTAAGKLREVERAQFIGMDVSYQPVPVKTIKPKVVKIKSQTKKFDRAACAEAANKYNVPASGVQSIVISRGMSYEDAAKHLHGLINK
jgi:hypothetical protein